LCESKSFESSSEDDKYTKSSKQDNLNYILIDIRISEEKENSVYYDSKPGFLPLTVILDQKELLDEYVRIIKVFLYSAQKIFLTDFLRKKKNTILFLLLRKQIILKIMRTNFTKKRSLSEKRKR